MKKNLISLIIAFVLCFSVNAFSQTCQWAEKISGGVLDHAYSISSDASGNIYVAGYFNSPTLTFNNGMTLSNSGDYDTYIAKYNSVGVCQWAEKIAGTSADYTFKYSISTDANGNVYVAGYTSSALLTFNNGISLTCTGIYYFSDGYIAKYNSDGVCQWAEKIAGPSDDRAWAVITDANGNVYVAGYFWTTTITFNNGITLTNTSVRDGYIAKYNSDGVCQWAEKIAGTGNDFANSISTDNNGSVYVAGSFTSTELIFNNGIYLSTNGSIYGYIAKYNSDGVCQWAEIIGKTTGNLDLYSTNSINADANGNVYVAGQFYNPTLTFNNGITLSNSGEEDGYIAKYDSSGLCQWAEKIAGTDYDRLYSLNTDAYGYVYVAGNFSSDTLSFNNGITLSNSGGWDGYIAKYDSSGVCQWAEKIASSQSDYAHSINTDANGNIYVAGDFGENTLTFNNGITLSGGVSSDDGYIAKYTQQQISLNPPILLAPQNNASNIPINPLLEWSSVENATSYTLQIATDADFENIIVDDTEITDTSNQVNDLIIYTTYFWRVKAANNLVESSWSEVWSFATGFNLNYGLAAWFRFDGDFNDYSGNNYNGINFGASWTENRFGEPNKALLFDGNSSGVRLDNGYPPVFSGSLTVSMWAYFNDSNRSILLGSYDTEYCVNFEKHITPNNSLRIYWNFGEVNIFSSENSVTTDTWYLLTYIRDIQNNQFRFYVNGQEIASYSNTGTDVVPSGPFWIGRDSRTGITVHNGKIDDVRIYNRAINQGEILELYNEQPPVILSAPSLLLPENNNTNQILTPTLQWQAVENATSYTLQVTTNENFEEFILNQSGIEETEFQLFDLDNNTTYYWRVNATNGEQTSNWSEVWSFTTVTAPEFIDINLSSGWNAISSNILPNAPNMDSIFSDDENIVLVKNGSGQVYIPSQNINQIGDWNIAHGYMVYVTAPATLQITGTAVNPAETEINLVTGWNLVSYLRKSPLAINTAMAGISSSIILVKNNLGQLYYPAYGLNTLGNMQQGQGYWIYMSSPAALVYPGN